MESKKTTFALYFGNRGFFPMSLIAAARAEMQKVLTTLGHEVLMLDETETRYGAVETTSEGELYANFLARNRGKFGGVILCLPNFGDENGAIAALKDCGVPILIQAYPDEMDKMAPATRRDAFCGKFSIMDVFVQSGLKFTILPPHTTWPSGMHFPRQIDYFDRLCRVVNGMRSMTVGAIGARTTAFKTVRIDELALQRHGITMETLDLSSVMAMMRGDLSEEELKDKMIELRDYSSWDGVPDQSFNTLARLGVVLDQCVEDYQLDALALRCWVEWQEQMKISPCVLLSMLNNNGTPTACEVDMGNAITMAALRLASGEVTTCLDWNNNYGNQDDKCILFHCGPVPQAMMTDKGRIVDHAILANAVGAGCGWGCNAGRIKPGEMSFGSMLTKDGKLKFYLGEGTFTRDRIPEDFFGCAGVAQIPALQDVLMKIGNAGHRHHTSVTPGHIVAPVAEAFEKYLGYDVMQV